MSSSQWQSSGEQKHSEPAAANPTLNATAARQEVQTAEQKVALGIAYLQALSQQQKDFTYDGQKIATVTLEKNDPALDTSVPTPFGECALRNLFPNHLQNGVTVHFFGEGYIQHPPAFYMAQQKLRSLYQAALLPPINLKNGEDILKNRETELRYNIDSLAASLKDKNLSQSKKDKEFHVGVRDLIKAAASMLVKELQTIYQFDNNSTKVDSFKTFSEKLLSTSTHHRSDAHDILTFDNAEKHFSYDEAAAVTAHDRIIGSGCANLSILFEGKYSDANMQAGLISAEVTSSAIKHASPVAIDSIGKVVETTLLADTYRNMQKIIKTMVRLRQHGRAAADRKNPMAINWVYQILTTNIGNIDHQADTYDYVTRTARLLNHSDQEVDRTPVKVSVSVFNAGINKAGDYGKDMPVIMQKFIHKNDTQRRENRHAYLQLSATVATINTATDAIAVTPADELFLREAVHALKNSVLPEVDDPKENAEVLRAQLQLAALQIEIGKNSNLVAAHHREIQAYETSRAAEVQALTGFAKGSLQYKYKISTIRSLDMMAANIQQRHASIMETCDAQAKDNYEHMIKLSGMFEEHQRERWVKNSEAVKLVITRIQNYLEKNQATLNERLSNAKTYEKTSQQLLALTSLIYKVYADQLYYGDGSRYSEVYRSPEKAALMNAYIISFQRLTGMMASFGCKSGNDRTLVMRLLVAALAFRDPTKNPLPEALHLHSLIDSNLSPVLSGMAMSNSALFSAINDTAGGTAKVDPHKFPYMAGVRNLELIGDFGEKFAAHKMKIDDPLDLNRQSAKTISMKHLKNLFTQPAESKTKPRAATMPVASQPQEFKEPKGPGKGSSQ